MNSPWRNLVLRDVVLLLAVGVAVIGAGMGLRNPWPADEPVYSLIARDMLATGNWLIPMVGGDFFQDKPPLLFWLQAAGYWLTGSEKIGFLLPSLLAGVGTLLLIYDLGRRLWTREAGMYAALLLLFTVQFTLQSRRAQLDALLMFFTVLSLYCLLRQLLLGGGWRWALAAGLAAGFGVLTKVVGFFSFFLLVPWLFAVWRNWPGVKWQRPWPAWALAPLACGVVVAAWLLPIWLAARNDPAISAYFHELVLVQTLGRYVDPWHHYRPIWYYLQVMATVWLPLALLLPWLLPCWRDALRDRDARVLLPLGFALLYVTFFTLSRGKRDVYILPALPMLALAAGYLVPQLLRVRGVQRLLGGFVLLLATACIAGFAWLQFVQPTRGSSLLAETGINSLAPLLVIGASCLVLLAVLRWQQVHLALAGALATAWMVLGWWVFPQMDGERSAANFITKVQRAAAPDRALGLLAYHEHFLWHLQRPTVNFGHRRFREGDAEMYDAAAWLGAQPQRQLLVPQRMLRPCFANLASMVEVGESSRGSWYLVAGSPATDCVARGNAQRVFHYTPSL